MKPTETELNLPFRPRARLLQLLGDQLIGTPRLAVFELVKNAYDADAENVTVTLRDLGTDKVSIVVRDDGDGMTLDTIRDIWLVPAHDHRELQRKSKRRTAKKRLPLGEKGLGRFAVHKLGDRIKLITRAENSLECVVSIDWNSIINTPFLADAAVKVSTREPEVFTGDKTGTRISIYELRGTSWSRGEVRRLLRQITSISSPFKSRSDKFDAVLKVPDHPEWVSGVPDTKAILARAPWYFRFSFENGKIDWTYEFRGITGIKLEARRIAKESEPLLLPLDRTSENTGKDWNEKGAKPKRTVASAETAKGIGPVQGEIYVFDRDRAVLNKIGDSQLIGSFLDEHGGIRVYRDGIRVYNYGEPGDDWLGLDLRRVNTPTRNLSRNIVVGAIDLSLEDSEELLEKTSREGFIDNDAYGRFQKIALGAISLLEIERKVDKDRIRLLTQKGHDPETDKISKPLDALRDAVKRHRLEQELDPLIDKVQRDYDEMRETMLRAGLSGMGLAVVFHEIEQGVRVLHNAIEAGGGQELVQTQARELVRILDGFTELLRKGDRQSNSLKHLLRRARDINRVRFRNHNVRLVCPAAEDEAPDVKAVFAFSLALGALNNLLDNAFYWLQVRWPDEEQKPSPRAIYMNVVNDLPGGPAIVISDTGPGFSDDPINLIRPFFSRRPDGMGVGLYYANLVMELNSGHLAFPGREEADVPDEFDGALIALVFGPSEERK